MDARVRRLKNSLTAARLSELTEYVIELYRNRDFHSLRSIFARIRSASPSLPDTTDPARIFTAIIKRIHPDRLNHYIAEIDSARISGDSRILSELEAILDLTSRDPIRTQYHQQTGRNRRAHATSGTQTEYDESLMSEEQWGYGSEDFDEIRDTKPLESEDEEDESEDEMEGEAAHCRSFLEALLLEEHGLTAEDLTPELLAAIEEQLDLSDYAIDDLTQLSACANLVSLNLSANEIEDIEEVGSLLRLRELNLAQNHISDICALSGLHELRELDLSFNHIEDISSLYSLPKLEFVNLVGNPIKESDLIRLQEKGMMAVA